ncbi:MAG: radical SAM protein [Chloroflexi bacterium]|nr:radical SAM protein [Chloroflexota bacterium]
MMTTRTMLRSFRSAQAMKSRRTARPRMLVAGAKGDVHPTQAEAMGRQGWDIVPVEEWIPLPKGAQLLTMPECRPVGTVRGMLDSDREGLPVAAALPHGFTRTFLPAYRKREGAEPLPLFGYTAVAELNGELVVAAVQTDAMPEWQPEHFNTRDLAARVEAGIRAAPFNAVLAQLRRCALEYGCYTAQNTFYGRWEAAIPTSNACNARCVGCISEQEPDGPPSPQQRIHEMARQRDIVEAAVRHLESADRAMVSFGQGCEGEPLLNWRTLVRCVEEIRRRTHRGWININTNGSSPRAMEALIRAGLNTCRVSVFSARQSIFAAYYRPRNYAFADVQRSLQLASDAGLFTSINLLTFPGVTDQEREIDALIGFLQRTRTRLVQLRNLTIDPEQLLEALPPGDSPARGVRYLLERLRTAVPGLLIGNASPLPGSFDKAGEKV